MLAKEFEFRSCFCIVQIKVVLFYNLYHSSYARHQTYCFIPHSQATKYY